jgi:hypothetical protein
LLHVGVVSGHRKKAILRIHGGLTAVSVNRGDRLETSTGEDLAVSVEGFWNVAVKTPLGTRRTVLEIWTADGGLQGLSRGEKEQLTLEGLHREGNRLTWSQNITKPMRMVLSFDVTVDGDEMNGTARGGPMPAATVSGSRAAAPQNT